LRTMSISFAPPGFALRIVLLAVASRPVRSTYMRSAPSMMTLCTPMRRRYFPLQPLDSWGYLLALEMGCYIGHWGMPVSCYPGRAQRACKHVVRV
jgi:hypothetical protein